MDELEEKDSDRIQVKVCNRSKKSSITLWKR